MPSIRAVAYALSTLVASHFASAKDWDSPVYNYLFQFPLPSPPVKAPLK